MKKEEKTTAVIGLIVIIAILAVIIASAVVYLVKNFVSDSSSDKGYDDPMTAAAMYISGLDTGENGEKYSISTDGERLCIDCEPQTEDGKKLFGLLRENWTAEIQNSRFDDETGMAVVPANITCPDITAVTERTRGEVIALLEEKASQTVDKSEMYDGEDSFRQDVLDEVFYKALETACNETETKVIAVAELQVKYSHKKWVMASYASTCDTLDEKAAQIKKTATENLEYIPVNFTIDENATSAPAPDQTKFGETQDPAVISALLETKEAKRLIGDQELVWNPDIQFISEKKMRYYLDDSILMIQWSETEAKAVGTFSEIFIADGSQFRRKIAGDSFGDMNFETCSDFAKDTNAVLALGGDFYNHGRNCGIVVYQRNIYRFDNSTCDICYIDTDGDMKFSYRNQFQTVEQAKQFVEDNDILFSLSFGPVLVDDGVDKTPGEYTWGEINDTYARSALGMLGRHHYLSMNINCEMPNRYYLATLRQAADAMIKRGCIKAYTLDGGQTATTVVNGQLVNPVQFGAERTISDIIYFCTAIPENK